MAESKKAESKQATSSLDVDPLDHQAVQAAGYWGHAVDPTPRSAYTVAGNAEPTPETDGDLAQKAQERARELAS